MCTVLLPPGDNPIAVKYNHNNITIHQLLHVSGLFDLPSGCIQLHKTVPWQELVCCNITDFNKTLCIRLLEL